MVLYVNGIIQFSLLFVFGIFCDLGDFLRLYLYILHVKVSYTCRSLTRVCVLVSFMTLIMTSIMTYIMTFVKTREMKRRRVPHIRTLLAKVFAEAFAEVVAKVVAKVFAKLLTNVPAYLETYTCKRPTRVIYINIKIKDYKNYKVYKNTQSELWNLYILQNNKIENVDCFSF